MIRNNNMAVAARMAVHHLKRGKRKSITMVLAVMAASFLLFCIFTVGITYFQMLRTQNMRLQGGVYDAVLYGVTDKQMEICEADPDVEKIGLFCMSGYIDETEYDKTTDIVAAYADKVYWEEIKAPVKTWVKGTYPTRENDVMVTKKVLKQCGLEGLDVGDCFKAVYAGKDHKTEKEFCISGIWEGFGDTEVMFVSEKFYQQSGFMPENVSSGRCVIAFQKDLMTEKQQNAFIDQLHLQKKQTLVFTGNYGHCVEIVTASVCLICMICLCAYLMIYNIMYLSVAGNIRYYGRLQMIGMTQRQIKRFVNMQMLVIGGVGITGGILLGAAISFGVVPVVVTSLGIHTAGTDRVMVTFYPGVFALTVLFTVFTLWAAGRKPAAIAVRCSPLAALGYRPAAIRKQSRKTAKGSLIWRITKEQLAKDKRRAAVVMLSLSAGMTVLLSISMLIQSQNSQNAIYNYRNFDLLLKNDTVSKEKKEDRISVFNQELLEEIRKTEGVAEAEPFLYTEIMIPWEPDFMDQWIREFYEVWIEDPEDKGAQRYRTHPEQFVSSLVGITKADFQEMNQALEEPVDEQAFLEGKTCLLFRSYLTLENKDAAGKKITCMQYGDQQKKRTFEIAAFTDQGMCTAYVGYTPTVIVIDQAVKEFVKDPDIFRINVRYQKEFDKKTEQALFGKLATIEHARDYSYISKIEEMREIQKAQGNMMQVGIGIVAILALVGFLNYINTFVGNIQSRQLEISVMESIGMTGRQVKKMLAIEGLLYAGGALMLTITAGMGVTYFLFQSMGYGNMDFIVPVVPVLAAGVVMAASCIFVPVFVYCRFAKTHTMIERIKGMEC